MTRLFLAEDYDILRESLIALLEKNDQFQVVGDANNGQAAVDACASEEVDVILMDIEMPIMNGIEASRIIKTKYPMVKIIMLTMHNEYDLIKPAMDIGVEGYLLKNTDPTELTKAIEMVMSGGAYFTPSTRETYTQGQIDARLKSRKLNAPELTQRECEIVRMIAEGKSTDEISGILDLSAHTVSSHRKNIYRKTGIKSSVDLTRFAYETGLIKIKGQ